MSAASSASLINPHIHNSNTEKKFVERIATNAIKRTRTCRTMLRKMIVLELSTLR